MPKKGPPLSFMQIGYVGRPGRRNPGTRRWSATLVSPKTRVLLLALFEHPSCTDDCPLLGVNGHDANGPL